MHRLFALAFLLVPGCGFLAETVSDSISLDLDTDVIPEASIADGNIPALTKSFSLSATTDSSYTLEELDTAVWLPLLAYEQRRRAAGGACTLTDCGNIINMDMTSFTLTGGYHVAFDVRVFSRDRGELPGLIFPLGLDEEPAEVPACSFTLTPDTHDGDDYAANLKKCLSDWLTTNGIPMEFDMEVTASQGGPRGGGPDYSTTGNFQMHSDTGHSGGTSEKILKLDNDVVQNRALVDCPNVTITGNGTTSETLDDISGTVWIFNGFEGHWVGEAKMEKKNLQEGAYTARVKGDDLEGVGPSTVLIEFPAGIKVDEHGISLWNGGVHTFLENALEAAAVPGSFGKATWSVDGPAPRDGTIFVNLTGPCTLN